MKKVSNLCLPLLDNVLLFTLTLQEANTIVAKAEERSLIIQGIRRGCHVSRWALMVLPHYGSASIVYLIV